MMPRSLKSSLVVILVVASLSSASIPRRGESPPLEPLVDWLLKTGKPSVVRSRIVEAMNLPAGDMPVHCEVLITILFVKNEKQCLTWREIDKVSTGNVENTPRIRFDTKWFVS